jgi:hypothetical protein
MRLSGSWWFVRCAALVATVLLCLGIFASFFSLPVSRSEGPAALAMVDEAHVDQGANENSPLLDRAFVFALAEEAEEIDKNPVNADLLTMLMLAVSSFFGLSIGWLLSSAQKQGAWCSLGVVGGVLGGTREDYLSFLEVFRL